MTTQAAHGSIPKCRFYDFVENGQNVIEVWLRGRPELRAQFHALLSHFAIIPIDQWASYYAFKWLATKKHAGLGEFRFVANKWEQRPVGCKGQGGGFILLVGCAKRGGLYVPSPPHPFDVAAQRRIAYHAKPASVAERLVL